MLCFLDIVIWNRKLEDENRIHYQTTIDNNIQFPIGEGIRRRRRRYKIYLRHEDPRNTLPRLLAD